MLLCEDLNHEKYSSVRLDGDKEIQVSFLFFSKAREIRFPPKGVV
ncbi:hypothetical protein B4143_2304 [Bacillus subtilis]|uniref:Uncharacterized protein n=1 Tax=Bacillus subtilis TaxID=1423 RepID=A0A0C3LJI8_BACIU|nr:Hypothetical Protein U712_11355 [Bacillus subtilis PY79]AKN14338.1 hypothetical protein ABU16_3262 [Bacillus subtilis]KIN30677.1 hypothetical protein B4069_2366 [Bacillus subtilis]KIN40576.1 hypothetical protein B4070_2226 [Bacillus subtilis]KIN52150.1 hypothetical protein B4146_2486 [Bacillus subtilis]